MGHAPAGAVLPRAGRNWAERLEGTAGRTVFRLLAMTPGSGSTTLPAAMTMVRDERVAILVGRRRGPGPELRRNEK